MDAFSRGSGRRRANTRRAAMPAWVCAVMAALCCVARAQDRGAVAEALEGASHIRLDAKSALRFFQLVTVFDDATNAVASAAADYAVAMEQLETLDAQNAAEFGLEPSRPYLFERSTGKLYRLETQEGKPPRLVRILERKLSEEEGQSWLVTQAERVELIARQQAAMDVIGNAEEEASDALAALRGEFGVDGQGWADLYLIPGRTDVMLVHGRYPVEPVRPVVPTRSGEVPDGALWVHSVSFEFPDNSRPVMARLIEEAGRLDAPGPANVTHVSEEWGEERVNVYDLAALLRSGRATLDGNQVEIRARTRDGGLVAKDSVLPAVTNLLAAVRDSGWYIAGLGQAVEEPEEGVLTVRVDPGRVGEMNVVFQGQTNGTWWSERQIQRRFARSAPGMPFNYGALYAAMSDANENPDLAMDTDVKIRQERGEDGSVSRVADLTLDVREAMPIHGVAQVGNDGSAQSGHWWAGASLRHQNLTRHDDTLSVEAQVALKDASLWAVSGSYLLPHYYGKGGSVGVFGGYSKLDINDLVPDIGVSGVGKYAGLRVSQRLWDSRGHRVELAVGQAYRWTSENLWYAGMDAGNRSATVAPYFAQLSWRQKRLDTLAGRTFATLEASHNFSGWLGTSRGLDQMRVGADSDYTIGRAQLARLQAVDGKTGAMESRWTLFARASAQTSSGPLVAAEQFGLGGASTVRGYAEREALGDNAAFASVELRSPVLAGALARRDRLQFVSFADAGWAGLRHKQPGEPGNSQMFAAGLGVRYGLWDNALLRFDWGFPLKDTRESNTKGRGHVNMQVQF